MSGSLGGNEARIKEDNIRESEADQKPQEKHKKTVCKIAVVQKKQTRPEHDFKQ